VLCLLAPCAAAFAQQPKQDKTTRELWSSDRQQARQAYEKKDWAAYRDAMLQYHKDFPGSSHALKDLGMAETQLGNDNAALKWMQQYVDRGLAFDLQKPELANLRSKGKLDGIEKRVNENSGPVGHSQTAFRLNSADLVAEDIAYDPEAKQFFISSVRQRKIIRCDLSGKCADFITQERAAPLWGVFAVHVDAARKTLWATTASMPPEIDHQKSDDGKSALLKFDLGSGKLLKRYEPQESTQHAMGDMTVAQNGDAFVSDGLSGDVFVVFHDRDKLEPLVPGGTFLSPQTPALSADEKTLFVPDYPAGIARVNLADRSIKWLEGSPALDGTDGLYFKDGWLIAVQNGLEPERVTRFHLNGDHQVDRSEVVASNTPGLGDPTHGVWVGSDFYFIANSGWDRVQDDGSMKPGETAEIRKVSFR
jgi:sugar lactone lactonase YvrE